MLMILWWTWTSIIWLQKLRLCPESVSKCLIFWHSYSISPWLDSLRNWIAKSAVYDQSKWDSMTYGQDYPVRQKMVELCFVNSLDFNMYLWPQVSGAHQNHYWQMIWSPFTASVSKFDSGHLSWDRHAPESGNSAYQFSSSLISHE